MEGWRVGGQKLEGQRLGKGTDECLSGKAECERVQKGGIWKGGM